MLSLTPSLLYQSPLGPTMATMPILFLIFTSLEHNTSHLQPTCLHYLLRNTWITQTQPEIKERSHSNRAPHDSLHCSLFHHACETNKDPTAQEVHAESCPDIGTGVWADDEAEAAATHLDESQVAYFHFI